MVMNNRRKFFKKVALAIGGFCFVSKQPCQSKDINRKLEAQIKAHVKRARERAKNYEAIANSTIREGVSCVEIPKHHYRVNPNLASKGLFND